MGDLIKLVHSSDENKTVAHVFQCDCDNTFFYKIKRGIWCPHCNEIYSDEEVCDVLPE